MIKTVHVSNVGRVRSVNEDSVWVEQLPQGYTIGIVADGMGGHQAGDTASRLAVETMTGDLSVLESGMSSEGLKAALSDAILHANDVIYSEASKHEDLYNMGTTVVALLLSGETGFIGHIGDSRAYKISNGEVVQLTEDHKLVYELYKSGQISLEKMKVHPMRNAITRALGTDAEVSVDLYPITLSAGEVLLLCSDGLSDLVSSQHIGQISGNQEIPLDERADRLLQLALLAGGDDNITVALFELQDGVAGQSIKEWDS